MTRNITEIVIKLVAAAIICAVVIFQGSRQASAADALIVDLGNGIVQEKVSGRMWQKDKSKRFETLEEAEHYVANLRLGSYTDWRLPTIYELYDLHYLFDLHKNGDVQMDLKGSYWSGKKDGEGMVGSWEVGDQCEPSRTYYKKKSGYVRAIRP